MVGNSENKPPLKEGMVGGPPLREGFGEPGKPWGGGGVGNFIGSGGFMGLNMFAGTAMGLYNIGHAAAREKEMDARYKKQQEDQERDRQHRLDRERKADERQNLQDALRGSQNEQQAAAKRAQLIMQQQAQDAADQANLSKQSARAHQVEMQQAEYNDYLHTIAQDPLHACMTGIGSTTHLATKFFTSIEDEPEVFLDCRLLAQLPLERENLLNSMWIDWRGNSIQDGKGIQISALYADGNLESLQDFGALRDLSFNVEDGEYYLPPDRIPVNPRIPKPWPPYFPFTGQFHKTDSGALIPIHSTIPEECPVVITDRNGIPNGQGNQSSLRAEDMYVTLPYSLQSGDASTYNPIYLRCTPNFVPRMSRNLYDFLSNTEDINSVVINNSEDFTWSDIHIYLVRQDDGSYKPADELSMDPSGIMDHFGLDWRPHYNDARVAAWRYQYERDPAILFAFAHQLCGQNGAEPGLKRFLSTISGIDNYFDYQGHGMAGTSGNKYFNSYDDSFQSTFLLPGIWNWQKEGSEELYSMRNFLVGLQEIGGILSNCNLAAQTYEGASVVIDEQALANCTASMENQQRQQQYKDQIMAKGAYWITVLNLIGNKQLEDQDINFDRQHWWLGSTLSGAKKYSELGDFSAAQITELADKRVEFLIDVIKQEHLFASSGPEFALFNKYSAVKSDDDYNSSLDINVPDLVYDDRPEAINKSTWENKKGEQQTNMPNALDVSGNIMLNRDGMGIPFHRNYFADITTLSNMFGTEAHRNRPINPKYVNKNLYDGRMNCYSEIGDFVCKKEPTWGKLVDIDGDIIECDKQGNFNQQWCKAWRDYVIAVPGRYSDVDASKYIATSENLTEFNERMNAEIAEHGSYTAAQSAARLNQIQISNTRHFSSNPSHIPGEDITISTTAEEDYDNNYEVTCAWVGEYDFRESDLQSDLGISGIRPPSSMFQNTDSINKLTYVDRIDNVYFGKAEDLGFTSPPGSEGDLAENQGWDNINITWNDVTNAETAAARAMNKERGEVMLDNENMSSPSRSFTSSIKHVCEGAALGMVDRSGGPIGFYNRDSNTDEGDGNLGIWLTENYIETIEEEGGQDSNELIAANLIRKIIRVSELMETRAYAGGKTVWAVTSARNNGDVVGDIEVKWRMTWDSNSMLMTTKSQDPDRAPVTGLEKNDDDTVYQPGSEENGLDRSNPLKNISRWQSYKPYNKFRNYPGAKNAGELDFKKPIYTSIPEQGQNWGVADPFIPGPKNGIGGAMVKDDELLSGVLPLSLPWTWRYENPPAPTSTGQTPAGGTRSALAWNGPDSRNENVSNKHSIRLGSGKTRAFLPDEFPNYGNLINADPDYPYSYQTNSSQADKVDAGIQFGISEPYGYKTYLDNFHIQTNASLWSDFKFGGQNFDVGVVNLREDYANPKENIASRHGLYSDAIPTTNSNERFSPRAFSLVPWLWPGISRGHWWKEIENYEYNVVGWNKLFFNAAYQSSDGTGTSARPMAGGYFIGINPGYDDQFGSGGWDDQSRKYPVPAVTNYASDEYQRSGFDLARTGWFPNTRQETVGSRIGSGKPFSASEDTAFLTGGSRLSPCWNDHSVCGRSSSDSQNEALSGGLSPYMEPYKRQDGQMWRDNRITGVGGSLPPRYNDPESGRDEVQTGPGWESWDTDEEHDGTAICRGWVGSGGMRTAPSGYGEDFGLGGARKGSYMCSYDDDQSMYWNDPRDQVRFDEQPINVRYVGWGAESGVNGVPRGPGMLIEQKWPGWQQPRLFAAFLRDAGLVEWVEWEGNIESGVAELGNSYANTHNFGQGSSGVSSDQYMRVADICTESAKGFGIHNPFSCVPGYVKIEQFTNEDDYNPDMPQTGGVGMITQVHTIKPLIGADMPLLGQIINNEIDKKSKWACARLRWAVNRRDNFSILELGAWGGIKGYINNLEGIINSITNCKNNEEALRTKKGGDSGYIISGTAGGAHDMGLDPVPPLPNNPGNLRKWLGHTNFSYHADLGDGGFVRQQQKCNDFEDDMNVKTIANCLAYSELCNCDYIGNGMFRRMIFKKNGGITYQYWNGSARGPSRQQNDFDDTGAIQNPVIEQGSYGSDDINGPGTWGNGPNYRPDGDLTSFSYNSRFLADEFMKISDIKSNKTFNTAVKDYDYLQGTNGTSIGYDNEKDMATPKSLMNYAKSKFVPNLENMRPDMHASYSDLTHACAVNILKKLYEHRGKCKPGSFGHDVFEAQINLNDDPETLSEVENEDDIYPRRKLCGENQAYVYLQIRKYAENDPDSIIIPPGYYVDFRNWETHAARKWFNWTDPNVISNQTTTEDINIIPDIVFRPFPQPWSCGMHIIPTCKERYFTDQVVKAASSQADINNNGMSAPGITDYVPRSGNVNGQWSLPPVTVQESRTWKYQIRLLERDIDMFRNPSAKILDDCGTQNILANFSYLGKSLSTKTGWWTSMSENNFSSSLYGINKFRIGVENSQYIGPEGVSFDQNPSPGTYYTMSAAHFNPYTGFLTSNRSTEMTRKVCIYDATKNSNTFVESIGLEKINGIDTEPLISRSDIDLNLELFQPPTIDELDRYPGMRPVDPTNGTTITNAGGVDSQLFARNVATAYNYKEMQALLLKDEVRQTKADSNDEIKKIHNYLAYGDAELTNVDYTGDTWTEKNDKLQPSSETLRAEPGLGSHPRGDYYGGVYLHKPLGSIFSTTGRPDGGGVAVNQEETQYNDDKIPFRRGDHITNSCIWRLAEGRYDYYRVRKAFSKMPEGNRRISDIMPDFWEGGDDGVWTPVGSQSGEQPDPVPLYKQLINNGEYYMWIKPPRTRELHMDPLYWFAGAYGIVRGIESISDDDEMGDENGLFKFNMDKAYFDNLFGHLRVSYQQMTDLQPTTDNPSGNPYELLDKIAQIREDIALRLNNNQFHYIRSEQIYQLIFKKYLQEWRFGIIYNNGERFDGNFWDNAKEMVGSSSMGVSYLYKAAHECIMPDSANGIVGLQFNGTGENGVNIDNSRLNQIGGLFYAGVKGNISEYYADPFSGATKYINLLHGGEDNGDVIRKINNRSVWWGTDRGKPFELNNSEKDAFNAFTIANEIYRINNFTFAGPQPFPHYGANTQAFNDYVAANDANKITRSFEEAHNGYWWNPPWVPLDIRYNTDTVIQNDDTNDLFTDYTGEESKTIPKRQYMPDYNTSNDGFAFLKNRTTEVFEKVLENDANAAFQDGRGINFNSDLTNGILKCYYVGLPMTRVYDSAGDGKVNKINGDYTMNSVSCGNDINLNRILWGPWLKQKIGNQSTEDLLADPSLEPELKMHYYPHVIKASPNEIMTKLMGWGYGVEGDIPIESGSFDYEDGFNLQSRIHLNRLNLENNPFGWLPENIGDRNNASYQDTSMLQDMRAQFPKLFEYLKSAPHIQWDGDWFNHPNMVVKFDSQYKDNRNANIGDQNYFEMQQGYTNYDVSVPLPISDRWLLYHLGGGVDEEAARARKGGYEYYGQNGSAYIHIDEYLNQPDSMVGGLYYRNSVPRNVEIRKLGLEALSIRWIPNNKKADQISNNVCEDYPELIVPERDLLLFNMVKLLTVAIKQHGIPYYNSVTTKTFENMDSSNMNLLKESAMNDGTSWAPQMFYDRWSPNSENREIFESPYVNLSNFLVKSRKISSYNYNIAHWIVYGPRGRSGPYLKMVSNDESFNGIMDSKGSRIGEKLISVSSPGYTNMRNTSDIFTVLPGNSNNSINVFSFNNAPYNPTFDGSILNSDLPDSENKEDISDDLSEELETLYIGEGFYNYSPVYTPNSEGGKNLAWDLKI